MNKFDMGFFDGWRWNFAVWIFHWGRWKWVYMAAHGLTTYRRDGLSLEFYSSVRIFYTPLDYNCT